MTITRRDFKKSIPVAGVAAVVLTTGALGIQSTATSATEMLPPRHEQVDGRLFAARAVAARAERSAALRASCVSAAASPGSARRCTATATGCSAWLSPPAATQQTG